MSQKYFRKASILLCLILAGFYPSESFAQCTNTTSGSQSACVRSGSYQGEILPNQGCGNFTSYANYGPGRYFRMPVLQGGCYSISTCGAPFDTHLACFEGIASTAPFAYNDDSGPICSGSSGSVNIVPNFTNHTRVDIRQYACRPGGSSSITVRVRQNNNLSFTSSNAMMCAGQTRTLTATPARASTGTYYSTAGDRGTFSGTGVFGTTFTAPSPAGPGQSFVVTYSFGYCTATQGISVSSRPSAANAGSNQVLCGSSASLSAQTPLIGSGVWTVINGPGSVASPTNPNSAVSGLVLGQTTTFQWTVTNGACTPSTDTVNITIDAPPTTANAGTNQNICDTTTVLSANAPATGTGQWSLVSGTGSIQSPGTPNTVINGLSGGSSSFVWTISNGVCPPSRDTVTILRDAQPTMAFAGPDMQTCGSTLNLTGNTPITGTGNWTILSGSGVLGTPSDPNSALTGVNVGTTILTWAITNGACPSSMDTVSITRSAPPSLPTFAGNTTVCYGQSTTLTANSAATMPTYTWWDASSGGNLMSATAVYNTPPLTANTNLFLQVNDGSSGCSSLRQQVSLTVNPLPIVNVGQDTTICDNAPTCLDAGPGMSSYLWSTGATTQVECVGDPGVYWVQVTNTNGCSNVDSITIQTVAAPSLNLGNDTLYCTGGDVMVGIPGAPGQTYAWNNFATTSQITVSTPGTYTLTCTDGNGCEAVDQVNVSELAQPVASFTVDDSNCPTVVFTDNSTDATSWSWSFGESSTSVTRNPQHNYANAGNGTYTVTLIATGPCGTDTITQALNINCLVGVNLPSSLSVMVYPNPNNGSFKVRFSGLDSEVSLSVFNAIGQQVIDRKVIDERGDFEEAIVIPEAAAGIYFVKVNVGSATITKRIVVK